MNWPLIIIIAIVVILVVGLIGLYNGLVQRRLRIDEAFAQIEVQLKRRHDLIPNLVNAVKGYMGFEQKVLTDVTNARANAVAAGAQGPAEQAAGRERADRHAALAVRGRRELPRAEGEPERPLAPGAADHHREPDRRSRASTTTPRVLDYNTEHRDVPERPDRRPRSASSSASSSTPSPRPRPSRPSTSTPGPDPARARRARLRCDHASDASTARSAGRTGANSVPARAASVIGLSRAARASPSATPGRRQRRRRRRRSLAFALFLGAAERRRLATTPATSWSSPPARRSEVDPTRGAAADERRAGDGDRREHADAQGLHHRRHGARTPSRPAATRSTRPSRSRPASSRSSTARSCRASSATSCRTSATTTSASRCSSACWSARSRSSPTSSCASRSGAA